MATARILVVDDELSMREFLTILLEREGYQADEAENADHALLRLESGGYDLVISDVNMPGLSGIELLGRIKQITPETAVLMITAYTTAEQAVEAMKLGAYDYIGKPFKVEEIKVLVRNALEKRQLQRENRILRSEVQERYSFSGLIGKSTRMKGVYSLIEKVAASNATVLILGESGTGKELAARAIHYNGPRKENRFVAVNCGAIPENLMEAELFGHRKGAFTGAVSDRVGLFEQAEGGTLFLDEIGEVPLLLQSKLLRVLQEREFRRIGDDIDRKSDVRIIAASNRDLEEQVREGSFREDLYYRLDVVQVKMPSLRERPEDIPLLVEHFYRKFTGEADILNAIENEALKVLISYPFPGNVRELENIVERSVVIGDKSITLGSLPHHVVDFQHARGHAEVFMIPAEGVNLEAYLDGIEKRYLLQALDQCGGVRKRRRSFLGSHLDHFDTGLQNSAWMKRGDNFCHFK